MDKKQFIEKCRKEFKEYRKNMMWSNEEGQTVAINLDTAENFLVNKLSECWDMAGEEKKVNITHVSSFLQGAKEILRIQSSEHSEGMKQRLIERLINKNEEWLNSLTSKQEDKK